MRGRIHVVLICVLAGAAVVFSVKWLAAPRGVSVLSPVDGTLFPSDIRSPVVRWTDMDPAHHAWTVRISFKDPRAGLEYATNEPRWTPSREVWDAVKKASLGSQSVLEVCAAGASGESCSRVRFSTSRDAVGAPIFFRAVPNPFPPEEDYVKIKWKLGRVSSYEPPAVVMKGQTKCFNCHVTSYDGKSFAFIYRTGRAAARAGYLLFRTPGKKVSWQWRDYFNWNDVLPESERKTHYALQSAISPDGRFIVSGARAMSNIEVTPAKDIISYTMVTKSSLFYYSTEDKTIKPLPGGSDDRYIRIPSCWSADGRSILYARALVTPQVVEWNLHPADDGTKKSQQPLTTRELDKIYPLKYDIYSIPFNGGKGGPETPVLGASHNGKSNYFARNSPDGKWLVFTQSENGGALVRPDSTLFIVPAGGGKPRRLRSNGPGATSWHSWSPNSRWLVFSSKETSASQTDLVLTHIDENGDDSPRIVLTQLRDEDGLSANLPEFFDLQPGQLEEIDASGVHGERPSAGR